MKNILVINCGSSSLKYQLLNMEDETVLAKGLIERIGMEKGIHSYSRPKTDDYREEEPIADHARGIELLMAALIHAPRVTVEEIW